MLLESTKDKIRTVLKGYGIAPIIPRVQRYESFAEYLDHAAQCPEKYRRRHATDTRWADLVKEAREGDAALGETARAQIDKLDETGILSAGPSALGPSVVGFAPIVPAALLGHPESMLARTVVASNRAPIRVFLGVGAGAWFSNEEIVNRGVAVAALVLALQMFRPVELFVWTAVSPYAEMPSLRCWPVSTSPMDLASVAFQIARPEMHRVFAFGMANWDHSVNGDFPILYDAKRDAIMDVARLAFDADENDLIIPRATDSQDDPLMTEPWTWLSDAIEAHKSGEATSHLQD